jgi:hypothetical protein
LEGVHLNRIDSLTERTIFYIEISRKPNRFRCFTGRGLRGRQRGGECLDPDVLLYSRGHFAGVYPVGINPAHIFVHSFFRQVSSMSEQQVEKNEDGCADVFATIALITVIVATAVFWLKGMV